MFSCFKPAAGKPAAGKPITTELSFGALPCLRSSHAPAFSFCKRYGIALTGGIACGKSFIASQLKKRSHVVIDADALVRQITAGGMGAEGEGGLGVVLGVEGEIDRRKLRELVFAMSRRVNVLRALCTLCLVWRLSRS